MTYAGSRSYDLEVGYNGYNEPSAAFQAQCDVTLGRQPELLRRAVAEPVLRCGGLRGHDAVHQPDAVPLRIEPAVPGVQRLQPRYNYQLLQPKPEQHRQADLRLSPVRVEQAVRQGPHRERQLHLRAALDRDRRLRGRGLRSPERGTVLLAAQAPRHGVRRVGSALAPESEKHRRVCARRLDGVTVAGFPVRPAVGHARQRRPCAGRRPEADRARRQEGRTVHLRGEAVRRPAERHDRTVHACWRSLPRTGAPSRTSSSASPSSAAPR